LSSNATYCFLINCASNSFRAEKLFKEHEKTLKSTFPNSEFIYVQPNESIAEKARERAEYHSVIVACGGDGTVNQAACGVRNSQASLGVIPLGSGNDFAQSIGLDGSFEQAIRVLKTGAIRKVDIITSDKGCFINTLGIGVDGTSNYYASKSNIRWGMLRYFMGGLAALFSSELFKAEIKISDKTLQLPDKTWMIALANGKSEGGRYTISPDSNHADGKLELLFVKPVSKLRLVIEFIKLSLDIPFDNRIVELYTITDTVEINIMPPQKIHADGEQWPLFGSGTFKLEARAISVFTNSSDL